MGDIIKNSPALKKLGFLEPNNQWLLYDERFENFFEFLAQNITDINFINDDEVYEFKEIDLDEKMQKANVDGVPCVNFANGERTVQSELDVLLEIENCDAAKLAALTAEIEELKQIERDANELLEIKRFQKARANMRLNELNEELIELEAQDGEKMNNCLLKAKQLEALQAENMEIYKEAKKRFSIVSPPSLFHLLPLENYYNKIDACNQLLNMYLQQNYKLLEYEMPIDDQQDSDDALALLHKLNQLKEMLIDVTLKLYDEQNQIKVLFAITDELELKQQLDNGSTITMHDIARKNHELALLNDHHWQVTIENLQNDLETCVKELAQQRIELVLMENTKTKLERALKRRQKEKDLASLIKNMLLNAEVIWVAINLDIERLQNRVDVPKQQSNEAHACWQRIRRMHAVNVAAERKNLKQMFLEMLAELLSSVKRQQQQQQHIRGELKACLNANEIFQRQVTETMRNVIEGRAYDEAKSKMQQLVNLEKQMRPLVHYSPIEAPLLYGVNHMRAIFKATELLIASTENVRDLRMQFQKNYVEKMESDALFRASHLLWIWFLEDPECMLKAIKDAKFTAATKRINCAKHLSGIQRRQ